MQNPKNVKPVMIAIGGLSGAGKTTLAKALAPRLRNAVVLDSDELRKKMHGVLPHVALPKEAYSPDGNRRFIAYAQAEAARHLSEGRNVIVTGTFLDHDRRRCQTGIAQAHNADFVGIYLEAPLSLLYSRVARRRNTGAASDAGVLVLLRQAKSVMLSAAEQKDWHPLSANQGVDSLREKALALIPAKHKRPLKKIRPPKGPPQ